MASRRLYEMDAARGFLMLLGLVIHAAMIYSPERWRVHDPSGGIGFAWLVSGIHSFRMQAFFVIAGFFTAFGIDRQPISEYLRVRGLRLMLPLAATLLTFNVLEFWLVSQLPPANSGPRADPLLHLWFLVDLSTLTLLAAMALRENSRLYRSFASLAASAPNPAALLGLLTLVGCGFVLVGVVASQLLGREPSQSWGVADLERLATYFPYFALGMVLHRSEAVRRVFDGIHPIWFVPAVLVNAWLGCQSTDYFDWSLHLTRLLARTFLSWLTVGALLSLCIRVFSRPNANIRWLADASYPIYLSHESIIVALGSLMLVLHWPATAKFLVVVLVAFLVSAGFAVAVRNTRILRALYTGRLERSFGAVAQRAK